ncbi:MAG: hypothetical protein ACP5E2_14090 [Terracidiphilus sp.]
MADVFGIELETEGETGDAQQRIPAKSPRSKKAAATGTKKKKAVPTGVGSASEIRPAVSGKSAGSRRKTLTAAARKRIAEAQRKRWREAMERMRSQESNGKQLSPKPVKKTAKAKLAPSASGKPARRSRAV